MSHLEEKLAEQIRAANLPEPVREYRAIPTRRFRWDFAWPERMILLEVQGAVWVKGKHSPGVGITRDCEKATLAALAGFRCLAVTGNHVTSGQAIQWVQEALQEAA